MTNFAAINTFTCHFYDKPTNTRESLSGLFLSPYLTYTKKVHQKLMHLLLYNGDSISIRTLVPLAGGVVPLLPQHELLG